MENTTEHGPLRAPNWTTRGTRETLASSAQLNGLSIRDPGWYDVAGGVALVSDPTVEGGVETLRASVWDVDPRPNIAATLKLPTQSGLLPKRFVENWPRLIELSRQISARHRERLMAEGDAETPPFEGQPLPSLPDQPPVTTRICGTPSNGGHSHIAGFEVAFVMISADELKEARESGTKPSETSEVIFLDDGVIVIDME